MPVFITNHTRNWLVDVQEYFSYTNQNLYSFIVVSHCRSIYGSNSLGTLSGLHSQELRFLIEIEN